MPSTNIVWEGIEIAISHSSSKLYRPYDHIEVRADVPLPISETGYKSIFLFPEEIELFDSPTDYVLQLLDETVTPEWLDQNRQLTLF